MTDDTFIIPEALKKAQKQAADPKHSVWVAANAGSGKTHVLSERVVQLLLDGADPGSILCLTYTKAAAAEMKDRVFKKLAKWAVSDDKTLTKMLDAGTDLDRARQLFAKALETPGGLKVQTIHAFCGSILKRFPLEANIAGRFRVIDEIESEAMMAEARRAVLVAVHDAPQDAPIRQAFTRLVDRVSEAKLDALLTESLKKPAAICAALEAYGEGENRLPAIKAALGLDPALTMDDLIAQSWPLGPLDDAMLDRLLDLAERHDAKNAKKWWLIPQKAALAETDPAIRLPAILRAPLKGDGGIYGLDKFIIQKILNEEPSAGDIYTATAETAATLLEQVRRLELALDTDAALTLAAPLLARFEADKERLGLLDYGDVIARTRMLLARPDIGPWIQYKLDAGIEHVLVDEAQDTSPEQWDVIDRLTEELFAGEGAGAPGRSVFAVGDEKQSIYSFQGAEPDAFDRQRQHFETCSRDAGKPFERLWFNFSFRSGEDVLNAVDLVFAQPDAARGVYPDGKPGSHAAIKTSISGRVELWPPIRSEKAEKPENWFAVQDQGSDSRVRLAAAIAETIKDQIDRDLADPGDFLVLVRKRSIFNRALVRELKNRAIPVGGLDRLNLMDHIAVRDLVALAGIALNAGDDLALASLLKSPIFAFDDADLEQLAFWQIDQKPKKVTLLDALEACSDNDPRFAAAADRIRVWRKRADTEPVHEFFARILGAEGARRKLVARLGGETEDMLDEFLALAIAMEEEGRTGLQAFAHALETAPPTIKREMEKGRGEVRIMTAHGAKGLEAPHVFLVDEGGKVFDKSRQSAWIDLTPKLKLTPVCAAVRSGDWPNTGPFGGALDWLEARAEEEYRRLLYVGMTRAESTLTVCAAFGQNPENRSWHTLVSEGWAAADVEPVSDHPASDHLPGPVIRLRPKRSLVDRPQRDTVPSKDRPTLVLPDLPRDPGLPRPLAPSGATTLIEAGRAERDEAAPLLRSPVFDSSDQTPQWAIVRGNAIHRLLEVLPDRGPDQWEDDARLYLARLGPDWPTGMADEIVDEVRAVLREPDFAPFFGTDSRAEVPLMGRVVLKGEERLVSGLVDRLAVTEKGVFILDYKTNRPAPRTLTEVPQAYVAQLALYRLVLADLFPGRPVFASLLFSYAPSLMTIPDDHLDAALASLGITSVPAEN